jgi:hypothetical protein
VAAMSLPYKILVLLVGNAVQFLNPPIGYIFCGTYVLWNQRVTNVKATKIGQMITEILADSVI